jgi:D-proline reductase (dithiol) PrdB
VSLLARALEEAGISTVVIGMMRDIMERVKPPRGVFVNFPVGHPLGRPLDIEFQANVIKDALNALSEMKVGGGIIDLPYRWSNDFSWQYWPGALPCYIDKRKSRLLDLVIWYDEEGKAHRRMKYVLPVPGWDDDWSDKGNPERIGIICNC